ncbi:unnamed protein product, partial [Mesorhabditis spiculigera]
MRPALAIMLNSTRVPQVALSWKCQRGLMDLAKHVFYKDRNNTSLCPKNRTLFTIMNPWSPGDQSLATFIILDSRAERLAQGNAQNQEEARLRTQIFQNPAPKLPGRATMDHNIL